MLLDLDDVYKPLTHFPLFFIKPRSLCGPKLLWDRLGHISTLDAISLASYFLAGLL